MAKIRTSNVLAAPAGRSSAVTAQGISQEKDERALAPWPQIDRNPVIIGQGVSLQYIASVFRLCLIGYRQQYVDLLDELLEKDGHLYSVISKRVLAVACAKLEFTPAKTKTDAESELAQEICDAVEAQIRAIPNLVQHLAWLCWSLYYSIGALEKHWQKQGNQWKLVRFSDVHTRRLAYPDQGAWDLYIWDQGNVLGGQYWGQQAKTNGVHGLRIADYPGKFVVHSAQVRGDYPTRDGLGRQVATWVALKLIATRGAAQYLERFAKPWPEATYCTSDDHEKPRPATTADIDAAKAAMNALGTGSLSSFTHPDSIKLSLLTEGSGSGKAKLTFKEWIEICNSEHSKVAIGGTLTTEVGKSGGNRALGDTQKKSELTLEQYDANNVGETLTRDVIYWIVKLNFGDDALALAPTLKLHVEDEPSPEQVIDRAVAFASVCTAIDADAVAEEAGMPLVDATDPNARRLIPLKVVEPQTVDPEFQKRVALLPKQEVEEDAGAMDDKPSAKPTTKEPAAKPAH